MAHSSTDVDTTAKLEIWEFAGRLYSYPQVADCCLELQDNWQVNVNLLLWCYWLEARGCQLDLAAIQTAQARIQDLDKDYIQPLRAMRRQLKQDGAENLLEEMRQQIKQAELLGEHQLLNELAELSRYWPSTTPDQIISGHNAQTYLSHLGVAPTAVSTSCAQLDRALSHLQLGTRP